MPVITEHVTALEGMKKYPQELFYAGNEALLKRVKVSIIGSRRPSKYSRMFTLTLAQKLSSRGVCIVSGGAMGIDATAHNGAKAENTIAVLPCGIDIKYPAVNKNLLAEIEKKGLLLSQFAPDFRATPWSFVVRNELVVALGDVLVVAEAELESGSMRSIEIALEMGKKIYVLPQRLGESGATQMLLQEYKAEAIYDIDAFTAKFHTDIQDVSTQGNFCEDDFLMYCKNAPTYDDALKKFPNRLFEAELNGDIEVVNGKVLLK